MGYWLARPGAGLMVRADATVLGVSRHGWTWAECDDRAAPGAVALTPAELRDSVRQEQILGRDVDRRLHEEAFR